MHRLCLVPRIVPPFTPPKVSVPLGTLEGTGIGNWGYIVTLRQRHDALFLFHYFSENFLIFKDFSFISFNSLRLVNT
jgi:hypothetical protein